MIDFIRLNHAAILSFIFTLIVLFIIWRVAKGPLKEEGHFEVGRTIFRGLVVIILFGFGWYLIAQASVNNTPRSVIDRSVMHDQTRDIDSRNTNR